MTDLEQRIAAAEAEYDEARRDWFDARTKRKAARDRLQFLYRERRLAQISQGDGTQKANARAAEAFAMRQNGATFRAIAAHYGVSQARARQYVLRGERNARKNIDLGGQPF